MKLVDNRGMRAIDRRSQEEYGIPGEILMENAGIRLFEALREELDPPLSSPIVFLVGTGNNAGDVLVMARQALMQGFSRLAIVRVKEGQRGSARRWYEVCLKLGIPACTFTSEREAALALLREATLIVDGITGTGLSGPLRGEAAECVAVIAAFAGSAQGGATVVAVDAPSGVGDEFRSGHPVLPAAVTLTVSPAKTSLYLSAARPFAGRIRAVDIGFPPLVVEEAAGIVLMDEPECRRLLPPFPAESYKNRRGHLALFAGSVGTTGAAFLATEAASRGGAGLVTLFVDESIYGAAAAQLRAAMIRPLGKESELQLERFSLCLIGPGWGLEGREERFRFLLKEFDRGVIDADGLTLLAQTGTTLEGDWIITPHPGECGRLLSRSTREVLDDPFDAAAELASRYGAVVLLKGHVSFVVAPNGDRAVIDGMNPLMGTGGSGDLLAGFVGGLLADSRTTTFAAAAGGAWLHQEAGRYCAEAAGLFTASDLLPALSVAAAKVRYERA